MVCAPGGQAHLVLRDLACLTVTSWPLSCPSPNGPAHSGLPYPAHCPWPEPAPPPARNQISASSTTTTFLCPGSASQYHPQSLWVRHAPPALTSPSHVCLSKAVTLNTQLHSEFWGLLGRLPFWSPSWPCVQSAHTYTHTHPQRVRGALTRLPSVHESAGHPPPGTRGSRLRSLSEKSPPKAQAQGCQLPHQDGLNEAIVSTR